MLLAADDNDGEFADVDLSFNINEDGSNVTGDPKYLLTVALWKVDDDGIIEFIGGITSTLLFRVVVVVAGGNEAAGFLRLGAALSCCGIAGVTSSYARGGLRGRAGARAAAATARASATLSRITSASR